MSTPSHSRHTTLMRILDNEGNATFISAHPVMTEKTGIFNNAVFKKYAPGQLIVVHFTFSGTRRHVGFTKEWVNDADSFIIGFAGTLDSEAKAFASKFPELASRYATSAVSKAIEAEPTAEKQPEPKPIKRDRKLHGGEWINGIYMKSADVALFESVIALSEKSASNILLVGPSGCGKTSIPEAIAAAHGMKFLRMNCAVVRDPEEWFGYREAKDGSTVFVPTEFVETVKAGNAMIVLDEFNRVEPWLHNSLMPLLDHARATTVHGEEIKVGPRTVFVGTTNMGSRFTGTFMMDAAVLNRFDAVVYVDYLEAPVEAELIARRSSISGNLADTIVKAMVALRSYVKKQQIDIDVSTRSSLKVAKLASAGILPLDKIISYAVLNMIDDEALLKGALDTIMPIVSGR